MPADTAAVKPLPFTGGSLAASAAAARLLPFNPHPNPNPTLTLTLALTLTLTLTLTTTLIGELHARLPSSIHATAGPHTGISRKASAVPG